MPEFVFTNWAEKQFRTLPSALQDRIIKKLKQLKTIPDIYVVLKPLHNFGPATHRLRIGDYRLILRDNPGQNRVIVLDIGHRREVYR